MADLTKIQFIHQDAALIIREMQADLEARLNRQIAPADVEMLLINAFAYRETLVRTGINEAARQNLVAFSRGAALEYLGELVGVSRQPASSAACIIEFGLVTGHPAIVIPAGLRVQTLDGNIIFQTLDEIIVAEGINTVTTRAEATTTGANGNDYTANQVSILLDPIAFVSTAQNTTTTGGGADQETDDTLRERIKLAPASFSVAGPTDAYKFFAKSANPAIVDVAVTSPVPGEVHIFPLMTDGEMPVQSVLDEVLAICNGEKVRPLTDTVIVSEPTTVEYSIVVNLTLLTTAVAGAVKSQVENDLNTFKESRKNRLGLDVVRSKISSLCMIAGVYDVDVASPSASIVAAPDVYTKCTGITVNISGNHDE